VSGFWWFGIAGGLSAMGMVIILARSVLSKSPGSERMIELSKAIQEGAAAFLNREYRTVLFILIPVAIIIALVLRWETSFSFVLGAVVSGAAGYIGMWVATRSNARTTEAAKSGVKSALQVAVSGGAVMGMSVVGLALIGLCIVIFLFARTGISDDTAMIVNGYAMGASLIALFARSGGGIFTKGADMGADLVGKVEAGIPEDDPRNPAVIADNVGDNVGDVAGLGADLLESYVESIIASIAIAAALGMSSDSLGFLKWLPLAIASLGIFSSIIGIITVRGMGRRDPQAALMAGTYISAVLTAAGSFFLVRQWGIPFGDYNALGPFWAILAGVISGTVVGLVSELYTSGKYRPVRKLAENSQSGAAVTVVEGLSIGMKSTAIPVIVLAVAVIVAHHVAGTYGVALAALGMLATTGMVVTVDSYGPIADNAGGIAEMAHLHPSVRSVTDGLDAVGNTTAAIGKGFAIGSAAFAALGLLSAYMTTARIAPSDISLTDPNVMAGLLIGGMLPFFFSSLLFGAVSDAANQMINEVRRQFREIPGLMEGSASPQYAQCVDISTAGALRGMMVPGLLALAAPIIAGLSPLGPNGLGALLVGALVTGLMLGIQTANSGGAMDNAKKYIEDGHFGGKGSEAHKNAVVGDTVGDPLKDTVGPSINILIKLMCVVALVFAPLFMK